MIKSLFTSVDERTNGKTERVFISTYVIRYSNALFRMYNVLYMHICVRSHKNNG